jgi:hypothetical protein
MGHPNAWQLPQAVHSFESILMVLMVLMVPFIDGLPIKNGGFPWFPAC